MKEKTKKKKQQKTITSNDYEAQLIVFNDDYNDFSHVISCFTDICKLSYEKATALTYFIHTNGNGIVKRGEFDVLKSMKNKLLDCHLTAMVQRGELN